MQSYQYVHTLHTPGSHLRTYTSPHSLAGNRLPTLLLGCLATPGCGAYRIVCMTPAGRSEVALRRVNVQSGGGPPERWDVAHW